MVGSWSGVVIGELSDSGTDITGTLEDTHTDLGDGLGIGGVDDGGWGEANLHGDDMGVDGVLHDLRLSLSHLPHSPLSQPGSPPLSDLDLPLSEASLEAHQDSEPGSTRNDSEDLEPQNSITTQMGSSEQALPSSAVAHVPSDDPALPEKFKTKFEHLRRPPVAPSIQEKINLFGNSGGTQHSSHRGLGTGIHVPVSYTHLTLPTKA